MFLSAPEALFAFITIVTVAKMISQYFTQRHELALKHAQKQHPSPKEKLAPAREPQPRRSFGRYLGLIFLPAAIVLMVFLIIASVKIGQSLVENASKWTALPFSPSAEFTPTVTAEAIPAANFESQRVSQEGFQASLNEWIQAVPFEANQYPGIEACALPLAKKIVKEIEEANTRQGGAENHEPLFVEILNDSPNHNPDPNYVQEFNSAFMAALKKMNLSFRPNLSATEDDGRKAEVSVNISAGAVVCQLLLKKYQGGEEKLVFTGDRHLATIEKKQWLTDFEAFAAADSGSEYFVGTSKSTAALGSKAHEIAVQDAVDKFRLPPEQIEACIVDRFTQTIERSYGKVYREAILLRNLPLGQTVAGPATFSLGKPSFEFSVALIVCLTVVTGFISNGITQGYYQTGISRSIWTTCGIAVFLIGLIVFLSVVS